MQIENKSEVVTLTMSLTVANLLFCQTGLQIGMNSQDEPLYITGTKDNLTTAINKAEIVLNGRKLLGKPEHHQYYEERIQQLLNLKPQLK